MGDIVVYKRKITLCAKMSLQKNKIFAHTTFKFLKKVVPLKDKFWKEKTSNSL